MKFMFKNTLEKEIQETTMTDSLSLERALSMQKIITRDFKHGFNIFLALYTYLRYIIMEADDINAYAQAPTPYETFKCKCGRPVQRVILFQ